MENLNGSRSAPVLEVRNLHYVYPGGFRAIEDVSFTVNAGEFVSIVGPSGSGKTTLLKIVCGLLPVSGGSVAVSGQVLSGRVPPEVVLVFQDYSRSLFPWMTVQANVEFPLRGRVRDRDELVARSRESLAAVGLADFARKYPWQLSGGMQQRVAIARALAFRPSLLLMDEPFASLDMQTRSDLEDLLLSVHERFRTTILFVTHDIDESVYLSDRVLVLSPSPARLIADKEVHLPRPRDQVLTRELPEFVALRAEVASLILRRPTSGQHARSAAAPA